MAGVERGGWSVSGRKDFSRLVHHQCCPDCPCLGTQLLGAHVLEVEPFRRLLPLQLFLGLLNLQNHRSIRWHRGNDISSVDSGERGRWSLTFRVSGIQGC